MGRLKFIGLGLLTALGFLIVAMVVAVLTFDPNDYRERIELAVSEATGRDLSIDGELKLSLLPWLAVDVANVTLGNRPGFGDDPMFSIDRASLSLKLMPLFRGALEVGNIELTGTRILAIVNSEGVNNWSDIADNLSDDEPKADTSGVDIEIETGGDDLETIDVAGVALTNANVTYIDEVADARFDLSNFSFVSGAIRSGEPIEFEGGFGFSSQPQALAGNIRYEARIVEGDTEQSMGIPRIAIEGTLSGDDINDFPVAFELADTRIDFEAGSFVAEKFRLSLADFATSGNMSGTGLNDALAFSGQLEIEQFSPKQLLGELASGAPDTADPAALTEFSGQLDFAMAQDQMQLSNLRLVLDETTFTGSGRLAAGDPARISFDLTGDALDVDRYLAPATDDAAAASEASMDDTEIPADLLAGINAKGSLALGTATLNGMAFSDLKLGITVADKRARLNPLSAELFDGRYVGDIRVDASGNTPVLSLDERIEGVNLGPLATALFATENLSGTIDGRFTLRGTGATLGEVRQTLAGNIAFVLADGALEGRDVWHQIRSARALFKGEAAPPAPENPRTEFSDVSATGQVRDGVVNNDDFRAIIPFLQLSGKGAVNLANATLDYRMDARVLERPDFVDVPAEELDEYTEAVIPIRITGPLADPSIKPDIGALARAEAKKIVDEKKDEVRDRLLDKLGLGKDDEDDAEADDETTSGEPADVEDIAKDKAKKALEDLFNR